MLIEYCFEKWSCLTSGESREEPASVNMTSSLRCISYVLLFIVFLLMVPGKSKLVTKKTDGDLYLVGLFSICLSNDSDKNNTTGTGNGSHTTPNDRVDKAIFYYLHFMETIAFGNYFSDANEYKFGSLVYDVCHDQETLIGVLLDLVLHKSSFTSTETYSNQNGSRAVELMMPNHVAVYSYLSPELTKLAALYLAMTGISFVAIVDDKGVDGNKEMLPVHSFPYFHQLDLQTQDVVQLEKVFNALHWKSIIILCLSDDHEYVQNTRNLLKELEMKGDYCVYYWQVYRGHTNTRKNLSNIVYELKAREDLGVIYALGGVKETISFLDVVDSLEIRNRIFIVDINLIVRIHLIPLRLLSNIIFASAFVTIHVPELNYPVCNDPWFKLYSTSSRGPSAFYEKKCHHSSIGNNKNNSHKGTLFLKDLRVVEKNSTKIISKLFSFAVALPMFFGNPETFNSSLPTLQRDVSQKTQLYLRTGFYLIQYTNVTSFKLVYSSYQAKLEEEPFSVSVSLESGPPAANNSQDSNKSSPTTNNKSPRSVCLNLRPAPLGNVPTFGAINQQPSSDGWDVEIGWSYRLCLERTIRDSDNLTSCTECGSPLELSNDVRTICFDPYIDFGVYNTNSVEGILLIVVTILVSITCIVYLACHIWYHNTPVVKSSQFALTLVQLGCHAVVILMSTTEHLALTMLDGGLICVISPLVIGLAFVLNLCVTFIKTQTVVAIFQRRRKISIGTKARFNQERLFITMVIVGVSVLLSIASIINSSSSSAFSPQRTFSVILDMKVYERFRACDNGNNFQAQFILLVVLSLVCTMQSVRARRLPEYFKNTRFVVYAMYTNVMVMVVFFTLFNVKAEDKYTQSFFTVYTAHFSNGVILVAMHTSRVLNMMDGRKNTAIHLRGKVRRNIEKQQADQFKNTSIKTGAIISTSFKDAQ